jgi:tripartite-type tricarboxylate transporter receptor subunit TctC
MTLSQSRASKARALAIVAALAVSMLASDAWGQSYPNRPIRLVVGFAPGGAADTVARALSDPLGRALGQPIVIENRAGAGSSIAADNVAKSAPDGYSILIASPASISVNPALNPKLGYKPSDLAPITKVSTSPLIIVVNPATGITSVKDLVATARRQPGRLNYATSGVGSAPHFGAASFSQVTGVDMVHVPFKGGSPAVVSVVSGDTQVTFATPPSVLAMVKGGRLRALAVTSRERSPLMPDIPGMAEAGLPDYGIAFWYGLFVPAATPPDIIWKIFEAATEAAQRPEVKAALAREGTEVAVSKSPAEFAAFLEQDNRFWVKLAKDSGAKAD